MDTHNEATETETETAEDVKATLVGFLEELRAMVKEGGPAYERMAERIKARREAEIDSLIAEATEEEECSCGAPWSVLDENGEKVCFPCYDRD
jgi:hypothetical protein